MLKAAGLLLKVAASLTLLWLAVRGLDVGAALAVMKTRSVLAVAGGVALLFLAQVVTGVRWHGLLAAHGANVRQRTAVLLTLMGQMFNAAMPSTVGGDAARMFYAVRGGAALAPVTLTILLDRFIGLATITAMALTVAILQPVGLVFPPLWWAVVIFLSACIPAGLGGLVLANLSLDHPRVNAWLHRYAGQVLRAIGALRVRFRALVAAAGWSALCVLSIGGSLVLLSGGGDAGLSIAQGLAVAAPIILATSLPISIAGWGVREMVVVEIYTILGLPAEAGLATSLLFGLASLVLALPGLPIWLSMRRRAQRGDQSDVATPAAEAST